MKVTVTCDNCGNSFFLSNLVTKAKGDQDWELRCPVCDFTIGYLTRNQPGVSQIQIDRQNVVRIWRKDLNHET